MTQSGNGAEQAFERMLVSDPFKKADGNVVRSFYHPAVGYGQVEASADSPANAATVMFYDLPGPVRATAQPNYENVLATLADSSQDLELGKDSPAHTTVLRLAEKALGLQIVPPAFTLTGAKSTAFTLEEHIQNQYRLGEYGTDDPERLSRIEEVVGGIINTPEEDLINYDWEEAGDEKLLEQIDDSEGWQTIPDPLVLDEEIRAAAVISEDPDYGTRSFAIVSRHEDGSLRKVAFLSHLTEILPKQLLMMPTDPGRNSGAILMSWNSIQAQRFLDAAEKLLAIEKPGSTPK